MDIGLNTAYTGLVAAKTGLYTLSHNIGNAGRYGYSRQQISQRATSAHYMYKDGFLGTGTDIYNVERIRDDYLDFKFRNETAYMNDWDVKNRNLDEVQKTLSEPSNASFRRYLEDFYGSIENLSKNSGDVSYRQPMIENGAAMCKHINETYSKLELHQRGILKDVQDSVDKVNQLAKDIANLNKQIAMLEIDGRTANDLRDQRDVKIDELSKYAFLTVKEVDTLEQNSANPNEQYLDKKPIKHLDISIGGISLVHHGYYNQIKLKETKDDPVVPWDQADKTIKDGHVAYELQWENTGKVNLTGGKLKGLMDTYNGNGEHNSFRGIRFYKNKLNEFAYHFTKKFNKIHREGYTLGSDKEKSHNGENFFEEIDESRKNTAAFDMAVRNKIKNNPNLIAASDKEGAGPENNVNLRRMLGNGVGGREDNRFFSEGVSQGAPEDFIKSVISFVGVDKNQMERFYKTENLLVNSLSQRRLSVSGVEANEEMGDMVKFQQVYKASARMISTLDQLLDVTVNRLGMAGR